MFHSFSLYGCLDANKQAQSIFPNSGNFSVIKSILRRLQNLNFNEGQKGSKTPEHEMDSYTKKAINERFREIEDEENAK